MSADWENLQNFAANKFPGVENKPEFTSLDGKSMRPPLQLIG